MYVLQNDQTLKTEEQENHPPQPKASSIYTNSRESFYNHICLLIEFHESDIYKWLAWKLSKRALLHYNREKKSRGWI